MDALAIDDLPLYVSEGKINGKEEFTFLGFFAPDIIRPMFSRKEATFHRVHGRRAAVLTAESAAGQRVRALSASGATQALSTTYTENLYPDSPEQIRHKKDNDIALTVTDTVITLKKYRKGVGFLPWTDNDRFKRKRFDPDHIPAPRSWSRDRAQEAAREKFGLGATTARS